MYVPRDLNRHKSLNYLNNSHAWCRGCHVAFEGLGHICRRRVLSVVLYPHGLNVPWTLLPCTICHHFDQKETLSKVSLTRPKSCEGLTQTKQHCAGPSRFCEIHLRNPPDLQPVKPTLNSAIQAIGPSA